MKKTRPSILARDIKLLWGKAAALCSKCQMPLAMEGAAGSTLIGEMAHIIADKANGPRGDEAIEEQHLRSYDNLILLCANHHAEIDDDPATYTIEYLRNLKAEHEAWVNLRLGSPVISTGVEISYVIVSGDSGLDANWRREAEARSLGSMAETLSWYAVSLSPGLLVCRSCATLG